MTGPLEEMRVGIERHARAGVTQDATYLHDIEANVEDQMARERVTEIVEADATPISIEPGIDRCATKHAARDIVVKERRSASRREHVVRPLGIRRCVSMRP